MAKITNLKQSYQRSIPDQFSKEELTKLEALEEAFKIVDVSNNPISMNLRGLLSPEKLARLEKIRAMKWLSNIVSRALMNEAKRLGDLRIYKYYQKALRCCENIQVLSNGTFKTRYCKCRHCIICLNNETGKKIALYKEALMELPEPRFLTLTWAGRLTNHEQVRAQKITMEKVIRGAYMNLLMRHKRNPKKYQKLIGMPKIEFTTDSRHTIHLHFHAIVNGFENAEYIRNYWNKKVIKITGMNPKKKHLGKNQVANEGSIIECLKYVTKMVATTKKQADQEPDKIYVRPLHQGMKGLFKLQTVRPWNLPKNESNNTATVRADEIRFGEWEGTSWVDQEGEYITHTQIEDWRKERAKHIVTDRLKPDQPKMIRKENSSAYATEL